LAETDNSEEDGLHRCTCCCGNFDMDLEGGVEGFIGILPVCFCPTCKAGIFDFAEQMRPAIECPHCGKFIDEDEDCGDGK